MLRVDNVLQRKINYFAIQFEKAKRIETYFTVQQIVCSTLHYTTLHRTMQ